MFTIPFHQLNDKEIAANAQRSYELTDVQWEKEVWQFLIKWLSEEVTDIEVTTSGSTGLPQNIRHSKQNIRHSALLTKTAIGLLPNQHALLCLPVSRIGGIMMLVRAHFVRMNLICVKPSSNPLLEPELNLTIDFAAFTPAQMNVMLNNPVSFEKLNGIGTIILGGENISAPLQAQIKTLQPDVFATFGMTETISHIALKKMNGKNPDAHYKVLPGIGISTDERNCLVIDAPMLTPQKIHTNDIVSMHGINQFDWLGRWDNVINSGGIKIQAEQLETELQQQIPFPFFITSIPDNTYGQKVALALETVDIASAVLTKIEEAVSRLDKHRQPKAVLLIPAFARTENGKLIRKESMRRVVQTIAI